MAIDKLTAEAIEEERYELLEGPAYRFQPNRREFTQFLGAGLVIVISARAVSAQRGGGRGGRGRGDRQETAKISQRFHIGADGIVTVMTGKVEVGQDARTQVTQAVAEELRLAVDQIRVIMGDTQLCPDDGGTSGSRTTPSTIPRIRAAAAATRELLTDLAAAQLGVERDSVKAEKGTFADLRSNKKTTLGELAASEQLSSQLERAGGDGVSVARVAEWKVLGTSPAKVNARDIVTGEWRYPSDITHPGLLYGKVLRPPSLGAKLTSVDLGPAQAMEGVTVVRDGAFVGCAAPSSWLADQAVRALANRAHWEEVAGDQPSSQELFEHLKRHAAGGDEGRGGRSGANVWGNLEAGLASASRSLSASYTIPYIQHAPMEPRAAVAEWQDGRLTVWTGTQNPMRVRQELISVFGLDPERARVIVPDAGGAFGGKHTGETAIEAARLAQGAGRPVSLRWTREEEFMWAYCRPAGLIEVRAGLNPEGRLVAWDFTNYNSGGSAIGTPYRVPHGRTRFVASDSPLRQGSYRALASTANCFARESFMDELAAAAGADPLEFRRQHLPAGRLRDVLEVAAERFQWGRRRAEISPNRGVGVACGMEKNSYVAACAEVGVENGQIQVLHICQAYECGAIQNPVNLRAQVDGCIIMGLGGALWEAIEFEGGRVTNGRFSSYRVPRMSDLPSIETVLVNRPDLESVGAGETPIIAVAPAVANGLYHATGKPQHAIPLRLG
jgi:isoquinoline 1-oxidoreductase